MSFTGPQWGTPERLPEGPTSVGWALLGQAAVDVDVAASFTVPLSPENAALGPVMVKVRQHRRATRSAT